jgi:formate dehydrogenase iron-sulfur subunit
MLLAGKVVSLNDALKPTTSPLVTPQDLSRAASASFYHLRDASLQGCACRGLACFAARADNPARWAQACIQQPAAYCLGQCHHAPAVGGEAPAAAVTAHVRDPVLLGNLLRGGARDIGTYQSFGGGEGLRNALRTFSGKVIAEIEASGLRGRGGAGFPAARKWWAVAKAAAAQKYLVVNADEGDPGSFSDRLLLENDPFRLIEACVIAAHATGASEGIIYLRKEYPDARVVLERAIEQARLVGWLGRNIMGCAIDFDLRIHIGEGSYVCGEETSLLNSLEGRRPEVRLRLPHITEHGLHGQPTLVSNVETLCAVPWIMQHGGARYAGLGCSQSRGTKLLSLNSLFNRPGLYEVEFGISLREIVEELGGGLRRGVLKGVMVGGPLAGLVPPALLDTPLGYEELQAIGCALGHGGIIAFADDTSIAEIVAQVFRFGARESCGKCTPCHLGAPELATAFEAVLAGEKIPVARWHALIDALEATSLCGHGRGLAEFARAIERHYPEELARCFA